MVSFGLVVFLLVAVLVLVAGVLVVAVVVAVGVAVVVAGLVVSPFGVTAALGRTLGVVSLIVLLVFRVFQNEHLFEGLVELTPCRDLFFEVLPQ